MTRGRSVGLFLALVFVLAALPALAADVAGDWNFKVSAPDGDHAARLSLTQSGEQITGAFASADGQFKVDGTVRGDEIQFTVRYTGDQPMEIPFSGKIQGEKMSGEFKASEITGSWSAEKAK